MGEVVRCDCGFEARAADEDGLVAAIQRHAWEAHGMPVSHDEALLLACRSELDDTRPTTSSPKTATRAEETKEK